MKVHFKYPRTIDGTHFAGKKTHEVSDHLVDHWFLKALVKSGDAEITEEPKKKADESCDRPRDSLIEKPSTLLTAEPSVDSSAPKKSNPRNHKGK